MKVFISGPMSGFPDYNRAEFNRIANLLKRLHPDWIILNPAILPDGLGHGEYLTICSSMISIAEYIIALPGWRASKGACYEKELAQKENKPWIQAADVWPQLFKEEGGKSK